MTLDVELAINAATVLLNLALAVAVGAGMSMLWLARGSSPWAAAQARRLHLARWSGVVVAMVAAALLLLVESADMAEVPITEAFDAVGAMLTATHLGTAWVLGMVALAVSLLASVMPVAPHRRRGATLAALAGLAAFLYTRSMVSHAAGDGDFSARMLTDWLHLLLISVWVGEVVSAGFLTLASDVGRQTDDRSDAARYVASLSDSATVALAGIVATGALRAWQSIDSVSALVGHPYGTALAVKLGLVALAVLAGGANRFIIMPALLDGLKSGDLSARRALRRFALVLQLETIVLLAVLVAAAVLAASAPPGAT